MSVRHRRCYKYAYSSFLCLCLSLLLAAAGCGGSSSMSSSSTTKVLSSIATSPATADLAVGATEQFTAKAIYNDGSTADVTSSATWADANAKVASITSSGIATGVAAGSTTITATMGALSGTATLTIAGPAKTLASIAVSPATVAIATGATQQFSATATYSDGSTANVTTSATWVSSKPAVATISAAGLATALTTGSTTVTATVSGISSNAATLTVPASVATVTSIAITPATASIAAGATQQFVATATYSDGTTGNVTTTATWTSSKPTVAAVASGLAKGVAAGSTTLTASLNGVNGTATLTVTPTLSSIAVTPNPAAIEVGATQQFIATATYSDNSTKVVTSAATWKSANTGVATVNATGLASGVAANSTTVTATFNGISSNAATLNVTAVAITPSPATFAVGATEQFTAKQNNPDGTTTDITATANWTSANTAVATVASGGLATGVTPGTTTITASLNGMSGNVTVTVTGAGNTGVNISTWHVDNNRSGRNLNETSLTPTNVAAGTFGKLFSYLVDGYAYAEPLLISNVTIKGAVHNVLYVATEFDSVYAFDADTYGTGAPLWKTPLLQSGETPITGGTVQPFQGITSTPVIDTSSNTIYVVSAQKSSAGASYRLNALDITTGAPKFGSPIAIQASVPGTNSTHDGNGNVSLPAGCVQRAALLLANGTIYIGVGSCHSGWLLSYNAQTLQRTGVFNASPNIDGEGTYGGAGGVWMGSGGPVADSAGNIYISTGNGPWNPSQGSYGDSILKFSPSLQLLDSFTPQDYAFMNCNDSDLAAGGLLMIPGSGQVIGGGKMGKLYLVNTSNLGGEQSNDAGAVDTLYVEQGIDGSQPYPTSCTDASGTHNVSGVNSYEIFGTSAYFNGSIYLGVTPTSTTNAPGVVRRFTYTSGSTPASGTLTAEETTPLNIAQQQPENTRGTTPFISANGTNDGILWTIDQGQPLQTPLGPQATTNATLYAYDATNLSNLLYSSSANTGDVPGYGIKFSSPIVANGKVYISTGHDLVTASQPQGEIDVYGLK
jgi:Bacterial Ig-like domain (group 2)